LVEEIDEWSDEKLLNKAKVCIKGKLTRSVILLPGKSESKHFINPATAKISWIFLIGISAPTIFIGTRKTKYDLKNKWTLKTEK